MPPLEHFISLARSRQQRRRAAACAAVAGAVLVIGGIGWARGLGASQTPPPASGTASSSPSAARVVPFPSANPGSAYLATIGGPLSVTDSGCAYVKTVNPSLRNVGRRYVLAETTAGSWTTELVNGTWVIKDAAGTQIVVEGQEVTMGLGIGPGAVDGTEACKELLDDAQLLVLLPQG